MKIEGQVLNISQVQKLIELGFNVRKHSSIYYVPNWITKYGIDEIQDYDLVIGELREEDIDCIPTLTIGDIIDVLPTKIGKYILNINRRDVSYYDSSTNILFYAYRYRFIDSLFDCLVWVIKQKHIEL